MDQADRAVAARPAEGGKRRLKILRLDLIAFGPFTNTSLDFGPGDGLHVVHGPNEAGKSSSLRALSGLFFGIPARSTDGFQHANADLRIGGECEARDGTRLRFIRRKGNTKTLRSPDDSEVIDEGRLQRLLGGIDQDTFLSQFGIDHDELRRGGQAVVNGQGDLAELLFAAATGVVGLRAVKTRLDADAEKLFKPRGSSQTISVALKGFEEARKAIRESVLPTEDWLKHEKALRDEEARHAEIKDKLTEFRAEASRLERIEKSLPLIAQLRAARAEQDALGTIELLPEDFSNHRVAAQTKRIAATIAAEKAGQTIAQLEEELGRIHLPEDFLSRRATINELQTRLGQHEKAAEDRIRLEGERDTARKQSAELVRQLGRPEPKEGDEAVTLSTAERKQIRELMEDCKSLTTQKQAGADVVGKLDEKIEVEQRKWDALRVERDPSNLEAAAREIRKRSDLDEKLRTARLGLEGQRREADAGLKRLPHFSGALETLETLPIPSEPTIERFTDTISSAEAELSGFRAKQAELEVERERLRDDLEAMQREGDVATEAELQAARRSRDAGWDLILRCWQGKAPETHADVISFLNESGGFDSLATAFRASIDRADLLADRLRREANRAAQHAKLTIDLSRATSRLQDAIQKCENAERRLSDVCNDWRAEWQPAGIVPATPREMRAWRSLYQELVRQAQVIGTAAPQVEELAGRIGEDQTTLRHHLDALGETNSPHGETLGAMLDRCDAIVKNISKEQLERAKIQAELDRLHEARADAARVLSHRDKELNDWRARWSDAVARIGLPASATPKDADFVIDTIDQILKLRDDEIDKAQRIQGIDRDAGTYRQDVRELLQEAAPDLRDEPVEHSIRVLGERLRQAEVDHTNAANLKTQLEALRVALTLEEATIAETREALKAMCQQAECASDEELPRAEERSKALREAVANRKRLEQQLFDYTGGMEIEAWVEIVTPYDSDRVRADRTARGEAIDALDAESQLVSQEIGRHRGELDRMDGGDKAAEAQLEAESCLAALRGSVDEYIRLRLGSAVLSKAMERYREANQDPILKRASALFAALTLGSFMDLRLDYGERDKLQLFGMREGGRSVPVEGMSEGTCDQLYLALRLAALERSLEGREPIPFIVDDLLVMFDNLRATAALAALQDLATKTQVILFTHHRHVVDLAQKTLPDGEWQLHYLGKSD